MLHGEAHGSSVAHLRATYQGQSEHLDRQRPTALAIHGARASERQLNLQAGRLLRETVDLRPRALLSLTQRRRLGWISAGGAALGLALGIAAQITREVLITRYNDDAQCLDPQSLGLTRDQSCPDLRPSASTAQTAATVGWVSGGALAIAVVSLLVPTYRERRLALVPTTGAGLVGLTMGGSL